MLFSVVLLAIVIKVSLANSGSGTDEDFELETADCIPVQGAIFPETIYSTINDPETIARCICACTDHMTQSLPAVQSYSECNKIDSCVKGCVIGTASKTRNCTDICCENECLTIETNNLCMMPELACLLGCEEMINITNDDMLPSRHDSFEFVPSETMPILYVNETLQHNQSNITQVLIIQLSEEHSSSNFYILKDLSSEIVDLKYFACKEIMLSYAYANKYGLSEYSAKSLFTISGVNPLHPFGIDTIAISFKYDNRTGFFGHYSINMSWRSPLDVEMIDYFIIAMKSAIGNNCVSQNFSCNLEDTSNEEVICNVIAKESSGPPMSDCIYHMEVISVSVYANQFPSVVSYQTLITVPSYSPRMAEIKCIRYLNDDGYFDVLIHIALDDYVFSEQGIDLIEIIPKSIELNELDDVIDQDSFPIITKYLDYSNNQTSKLVELWTRNYNPKPTPKFIYQFVVYLSWREDLSYTPTIQSDVCSVSALALRPDTVHVIQLKMSAMRQSFTTISFAVAWVAPEMNGQFVKYQLCLVIDDMSANDEPNTVFCKESFEANQTYFSSDSWLSIDDSNVHCLQLQMRAVNSYFPGNWSMPLIVPVDKLCENTSMQSENVTTSDAISILTSKDFIRTSTSIETTSTATGREPLDNNNNHTPIVVGNVVGLAFLILTSAILFIIIGLHCHLRKRKRRLESIYENELDGVFQMGPRIQICTMDMSYDEWEIPSSKILMESILGQGAFGEVYKGIVMEPLPNGKIRNTLKQSSHHQVAIKLLKTSADGSERMDFLKEIDIMKKISERTSPHVVNMIGCVTAQEPLCLVIEYVEHGDLLTYLRLNRKKDSTEVYPELQELTSTDLVSFGYQIAAGLEFISSMGVVHRDVACRNVLVGEGKSLKISDFGMSRLIGYGEDDAYVKTTRGRLPLKWMAIESINDRQFTVASDVWSYGITLWEIATLGGFPYPTVENDTLLRKLKSGYRMECPGNCSTEIYHIMLECWSESPKKRPKFSTLRKQFDTILSAQHGNSYIDLQTDESNLIYTASKDEPVTRSPSPAMINCGKPLDTACLQVTNPWIRNSDVLSRSSFAESDHSRPMSLSIWDTKENTYVDQPPTIA